jgi:hypothetical protein
MTGSNSQSGQLGVSGPSSSVASRAAPIASITWSGMR